MSEKSREYRLADLLIDIQPGFARKPSKSGNTVHLRTNNISPDGMLDLSELKHVSATSYEIEKYSLNEGDVLFNNTNSDIWVGKTAFIDRPLNVLYSNHLTRLKVDRKKVDPHYLSIYLHKLQREGYFKSISTRWVNQAAVNTTLLRALVMKIPSLEKQRTTVDIVTRASSLKQKREQANQVTDNVSRAVFIKMFGDPANNPMKWKTMKLSQVGRIARGKSKHRPRNAPELLGGKYPFIQTGDVASSSGYIREYNQTYSEQGLKQSKMWPKGTLCITIAANIAATGILTFDACFPDSVVGFTPYDTVRTEYIRYFLSFLRKNLEAAAPQVAQKNINLEILSNLEIPIPSIELQNKFSVFVGEIEQLKTNQRQSSQKISNLFDSLLFNEFEGVPSS